MAFATRKLVTIVTEAALERLVVADIEKLGVRGYTITDARGSGSRGRRQSTWEHGGNVRVEVVCEEAVAERLVAHLRERYYDAYAMIVFLSDVEV
ncbi:MAG TPA: DUF3240 family protein, partial [Steroidobacteraceae bacterium]|nr:DUF3240 family protein [Steroidobacteraceae bacterium]